MGTGIKAGRGLDFLHSNTRVARQVGWAGMQRQMARKPDQDELLLLARLQKSHLERSICAKQDVSCPPS